MALVRPHINPKTNRPFTTAEYCAVMVEMYDTAYKEYEADPNPKKGEFKSPLGGRHDQQVLAYARGVLEVENPYEREQIAMDRLTDKQFLSQNIKGAL